MPRLPVSTSLEALSQKLGERNPLSVAEQCVIAAAKIAGDNFVIASECKRFREAWLGVRYARLVGAATVRCDDAPDIEIGSTHTQALFEVTEAMEDGRRRGDEYRTKVGIYHDDVDKRLEQFLPSLRKVANKKSLKAYGSNVGLLIYANMGMYGWHRDQVELALHDATRSAGSQFSEVAVFWESRWYRLWRDGNPEPIEPDSNLG